nr:hypothetical protein [Tanacetum cinerariifolium]
MTSFGYRLNPRYAIKECSSCGALYTRDCYCLKGNVEDEILLPKLPKKYVRCARCGQPVDGPYCQGCALLRKKLEEDLVIYFQYFQNTSKSSNDSTNIANVPREPFVVKKDHDVNSSQNPPHVDKCCCECDDTLDGIFCHNARVRIVLPSITMMMMMTWTTPLQSHPFYPPRIPISMGDEHLDTIPTTESDEVIKSSVEDLVQIPSEFEGIPNTMCDVHLVNNPTPLEAKNHFEIVINSNDDYSSSDDDYLYNENIEYVKASPHDSELVSLEVAEIAISEDEEIEGDNLRENFLNVNLLIAKIEALKDNPTPSFEFLTKSSSTSPKSFLEETKTFHNSLPEFEIFCFDLEEISSGSTTTHSDISLSEYDSFIFDLSNDQFPPTDRSDFTHEEFADELAHIISSPKYDCFYFRNLPDLSERFFILNSGIHENLSSTTRVNLPVEDDHSPLLVYVVWIFLAYLTYPVIPPYL